MENLYNPCDADTYRRVNCSYAIYIKIVAYIFIMKFIQTILKKFITKDKKILGRWNMEYCDNKMNTKIDLSNEDHCGPCGQYILDKTKREIMLYSPPPPPLKKI